MFSGFFIAHKQSNLSFFKSAFKWYLMHQLFLKLGFVWAFDNDNLKCVSMKGERWQCCHHKLTIFYVRTCIVIAKMHGLWTDLYRMSPAYSETQTEVNSFQNRKVLVFFREVLFSCYWRMGWKWILIGHPMHWPSCESTDTGGKFVHQIKYVNPLLFNPSMPFHRIAI